MTGGDGFDWLDALSLRLSDAALSVLAFVLGVLAAGAAIVAVWVIAVAVLHG